MAKYDDEDGVWRTIGGRRVFIKTGKSLSEAMKESGKFKVANKKNDHTSTKQEKKEIEDKVKQLYSDTWNGKKDYNELKAELDKMKKAGDITSDDVKRIREEIKDEYNKQHSATSYYAKMTEDEIKQDLEERKNKLDNNLYNEKDKKMYEDFYKQGKYDYESWYGKKDNEENTNFKRDIAKADTWEDIYKAIDKIDNNYIKENLKFSANKLEENENGVWKSASYLEKDYNFYEKEYNKDKEISDLYKKASERDTYKSQLDLSYARNRHDREVESEKEYQLFKKATENPNSIDAMTENSTDWEKLDTRYRTRYDNERLEIAKDIAKELYAMNDEHPRLEKQAKELLEPSDGYVLDDNETFYTNKNGNIELSTKALTEWRDRLKKDKVSSNDSLNQRYSGTIEYLKNETNLSNSQIMEILKRLDKDKNK